MLKVFINQAYLTKQNNHGKNKVSSKHFGGDSRAFNIIINTVHLWTHNAFLIQYLLTHHYQLLPSHHPYDNETKSN